MATPSELLYVYEKLRLQDANEAETRLKLIDRVVFDVLGWTHDDASVEHRVTEDGTTSFTDYIVRIAGVSFVIEAKRVGAAFSGLPNVRRQRLQGAFMSGDVGDAIVQARDYARKLSIPFAVVTNGAEWIAFPATRVDEVPFSKSTGIVFPSLQSALGDDRDEFIALLSRDAVASGSLAIELLGRNEDQIQERRLGSYFSNRGATPKANPLYPLIESAVVTAFTDSIVDKNRDLLEKCYVSTADRQRFDRQIGMHISKRAALFARRPARPLVKRGDENLLSETITTAAQRARPVAILMVGSVGAGKTTFLRHTRTVTNPDFFKETRAGAYPHWIYVDFRAQLPGQDPGQFIYQCIREYMTGDWYFSNYEQCIRPAYADQIRALREGPLKLIASDEAAVNTRIADYLLKQADSDAHVDRLLAYTAEKVPVFLVVDNVDQFDDDALQAVIFGVSVALAHRNKLNLVLSLRDSTFVRQRSTATFNAFDFNPIQIDPPPIPAVLSRRFFLMEQMLKGQPGSFISEGGAQFSTLR